MNFFEGKVQIEQDRPNFVMDGSKIGLPQRFKNSLASYNGKYVVLGIRPEHLSLTPIGKEQENYLLSTIIVVEPLGDRKEVYLQNIQGSKSVVNTGFQNNLKVGQEVKIYIQSEKIHVFENGENGRNITI